MEVIIDVELLQVHKLGLSHSYLLINIFIEFARKKKDIKLRDLSSLLIIINKQLFAFYT